MTFARVVFTIAGVFGIAGCAGLYFTPGTSTYYGLISVALAWQIVFFMIARHPARYRPIMIPAVLEKVFWVVTLGILAGNGQIAAAELAQNAIPHGLLGVLFGIAYFRLPRE